MQLTHQRFEERARIHANSTAFLSGNSGVLTYGEVNERANRLAHRLIALGACPERCVAVALGRTPALFTTLLAVMKSGAPYLPLDPSHPKDRLAYIVRNSAALIVIADDPDAWSGTSGVLPFHHLEAEANPESSENPNLRVDPQSASYVIYTSGSTGRPKGVVVSHRALSSFVTAMTMLTDMRPEDCFMALTTIGFDIATVEWLLPLTLGAKVVIANQEAACDGRLVFSVARQSGVTVMQATPTMWRLALASGEPPESLRLIFCGGEVLPADLANRLTEVETREAWNLYGPTETTVWSTAHRIRGKQLSDPPIGRPLSNTTVYVLDGDMRLAAAGVEGELYIGGSSVARGYLQEPRLTAERFVADPFSALPDQRLYRTGDIVRFNSSGELQFLRRADNQVKLRGHRVELGEVEAELRAIPEIRDAVALSRLDSSGENSLVAYIVTERNQTILSSILRNALRRRLPEYMIPSAFIELRELPLTPNGKTDRLALDVMAQPASVQVQTPYVAPVTTTEAVLVDLWTEIFGRKQVGTADDFFDLGGHSLLAIQILLGVRERLHKEITFVQLLDHSTVATLARVIDDAEVSTDEDLTLEI